jgi:hypothetical protein
MTSLFSQKRPIKKMIATLLFVAVLATVFFYRRPIAIQSIEYFAKPQDLTITCLDFSLDWQLNLNVKEACISVPAGEVLVKEAIWQPWSNILNIELLKVKHLATDNRVDNELPKENQTSSLNLPGSLPQLHISSIEIDSFELLQPLHLNVNTTSNNEWSISGDVNASVKMYQNTLDANLTWSVFDLTKWLPITQNLSQDNAELLSDLLDDKTKIQTHLNFDGKVLSTNSSLDIVTRFYVPNCPIETAFKGKLLIDLDISSLNSRLDLSQLENQVSLLDCSLAQDYVATTDLPQLSFIIPQKVTINGTLINLPKLQVVDKRNAHLNVLLSDVNYKTTGDLAVDYNISVKQPIKSKQIQGGEFNFQGVGAVAVDLSTLTTQGPISLKITEDNNSLVINNLKINALYVENLSSEFSFQHSDVKPLEIQGTLNSSGIQMGDIKLAKTNSVFTISGASFNDLQLSIDNQLFQFVHANANVRNIKNHLDVNVKQFAELSFSGNSTVSNLTAQNIKFLPVTVTHMGQASLPKMTVSSQHKIFLEQGFMVDVEQQAAKLDVQIEKQEILALKKIMSQLEKQLIVKQGNLSASLGFTLPQEGEQFLAQGKADFQGVSAKYQDYVLNNINYQTPLTFDSAGLQLTESTLYIDSIDAGVPIEKLEANVIAINSVFRLKQIHGEIFNGKFSSSHLWLDGRDQKLDINFQDIDLAQVVALQQQPGIKITGTMDGDLPMMMNKQGISIDEGWASSLTGGKLTIVDNPSFDSIKLQQPQLALLENLDFTQLKSNVKFTPDGWMFFDLALKGNNPDKKQSVNFNYTHQENIFSLLESIRLVNAVEDKIEQKITQGDKK